MFQLSGLACMVIGGGIFGLRPSLRQQRAAAWEVLTPLSLALIAVGVGLSCVGVYFWIRDLLKGE